MENTGEVLESRIIGEFEHPLLIGYVFAPNPDLSWNLGGGVSSRGEFDNVLRFQLDGQ